MHHLAVVRSLCTQDNSHSAGVARIQRGDPKNRGVDLSVLRLGRGQAARRRRQRPAAVRLDQAEQRRLHLPRTPASSARSTARSPSATASRRRTCCGPNDLTAEDDDERNELRKLADQRYAARPPQARPTEANSYVFDMAAQLQKRQRPVRRVEVRREGRRSATARTTSAGTCCWPAGCSKRASRSSR